MTRRRPAPGFSVSTKGHSVLRRYGGYGSPTASRRSYGYGLDYSNVSPVRSRYYSGEEDYLNRSVERATSIASDALYDTMDTANMSRNRDYDLLSATNSAIVNAETHSSPRAAVASHRARFRPMTQPLSARAVSPRRQVYQQVVRASSAPPMGALPIVVFAQPRQTWGRQFVRSRSRSPSVVRARSVDRDYGSYEYMLRGPLAPRVIREALDDTRRSRKDDRTNLLLAKYDRSISNAQRALSPSYGHYDYDYESPTRSRGYYISPTIARRLRRRRPLQYRNLNYNYYAPLTASTPLRRYWRYYADTEKASIPYYDLTYNPRYQNEVNRLLESLERPRSRKRKPKSLYAAIVASKLEDEPGSRRRRTPRSKYAADKYRATHKVGENPLYYSPPTQDSTSTLTASRGTVRYTYK